ncbi:MAG: Hsp20/alpha crystallin family protein [Kiritimatiellae bacterium]|nr:Hsp20/alpha crystallin family protein [Kiritimatiellia bacterium]
MKKNLVPWRRRASDSAMARHEDNPFADFHRQMNRLFDDFFSDFEDRPFGLRLPSAFERTDTATPRVDVSETDKEVTVKADLPGIAEKDVQVTLDEDVLIIRGTREDEREEKKRNYHIVERQYGEFQRSVPLPGGIDEEHVKASFEKGVLTVTLPKLPEAQSRKKTIAVTSE